MRIYEVAYAHKRYGERFTAVKVATRGFAKEAMQKADRSSTVRKWNGALRVESVILIAGT